MRIRVFPVTVLFIMSFISTLFASLLLPGLAHAERNHTSLLINNIEVQLPYVPKQVNNDLLVDVYSLQGILPITVEKRGLELVIRYGAHQLEIQPGRVAALLDGRWLILKNPPVSQMDGLLMPNKQLFDLLTIPYTVDQGVVSVTFKADTIAHLQKEIQKLEGPTSQIGFIGVLQPNRWVVAVQTISTGKMEGYGNLYEAARETNANGVSAWKLTKLRTISDTAAQVYMEWMPNESIFENIVSDKRSEFIIVETCSCTGRYQYGTMFTVTEMGLIPVWHSQATYERVEKTQKGWVLVTHRKDAIPTRISSTMPYWRIYEMWNGQSFTITKQEYIDPIDKKR